MANDKDKEKVPVTEVLEEDDEFEVGRHVIPGILVFHCLDAYART